MSPGVTDADVDELVDVKTAFYVGNYQQAVNEAQRAKPSTPELKVERDVYLYRSFIVQKKYSIVLDEIRDSSPPEHKSVRLLAEYLSTPSKQAQIVSHLDQQSTHGMDVNNWVECVAAATIYMQEDNYEAALRILHLSDHLECGAMSAQIYLLMDRVDLARKEVKSMQEKDEDAILTQMAQGWVCMAMGGEKYQEAYYIFQEMIEKHGLSVLLLNSQAACFIGQGKYEEAEAALQDALDKDSNNPDTIINLIVLSQHTGKAPEVANRYLVQLRDTHSSHPFVKAYQQKEAEFDRLCKEYSLSE